MEKSGVSRLLNTEGLSFYIARYKCGEFLFTPDSGTDDLYFVVKGKIKIYGINENGYLTSVSLESHPVIFGDVEYVTKNQWRYFAEAHTDVVSLVLPVRRHRNKLEKDPLFLHTLLQSMAKKLYVFSAMESANNSVEERLIIYIETFCENRELKGVDEATIRLRCSRRQLQRVLQKLCAEGRLVKLKKGTYRLP